MTGLFFVVLSTLFARDIGVLVIASSHTVDSLCQYINLEAPTASFSTVLSPLPQSCSDRVERVSYITFPYAVFSGVCLNDISLLNFKKIPYNHKIASCVYSSGYLLDTKALFFEDAMHNLRFVENLPSTFSWISGGISKENEDSFVYASSQTKVVVFKIVNSTEQFISSISSSTFFLLDERSGVDIYSLFITAISSGYGIKSVGYLIENSVFPNSDSSFECYTRFLNPSKKNYLSYLNRVAEDILLQSDENNDQVFSYFCDLISYYNDLTPSDEFYNRVRDVTSAIYALMSKNVPYFVYTDFLDEDIRRFSVERAKDYIRYLSDSVSFEVRRDGDKAVFVVSSSTSLAQNIQVYADINKRAGQGNRSIISTSYKMDDRNAWEYSFIISKESVLFYSATLHDYQIVKRLSLNRRDNEVSFSIPFSEIKGDPFSWSYTLIIPSQTISGIFRKLSTSIITSVDD
ncbi:MAG: hypothetical protein ACP5IO_06590 [Elusimicrobiales bacterium]